MRLCGKSFAISVFLVATTGSAVFADSVSMTGPVEPTLEILPGSDGEDTVSTEIVSSISAIEVVGSAESGYPVLSVLFGRVPIPTPRPSYSERPDVASPVSLVRPGQRVTKPRKSAASAVRSGNVALNIARKRIPTPLPPIIGVYR